MSESIKVAVRIRPLVDSEKNRGCQSCLDVSAAYPQVQIGKDKSYSYNYVFDQDSTQEDIYCACVEQLVRQLFKGFNVTILAYGQTGSGKTHTMGTCYNGVGDKGVIPRAVEDIFQYIESNRDWEFRVFVSFIELYNEQLFDLLCGERVSVDLREDTKGIIIPGLTEKPVFTCNGTMDCLQSGALGRTTGATAMNNQSSRSHAIFTITIHQQKNGDVNSATTSKFHLVDLAGSERSKKTQAVGERFKEGVNINNGLLHLGNVIQALGDGSKHVPSYRNSKLTRLLQDSLGGNSLTLMIACVSPADYNVDETLSTLRYADRAKRIKNKPVVNQDPKAAEITALKAKIQELQLNQNRSCPASHDEMEEEIRRLNNKIRVTNQRYNDAVNENTVLCERMMLAENARDRTQQKITELEAEINLQVEQFVRLLETVPCPESVQSQLNILKTNMSEKLAGVQEVQKKSEAEIRTHEQSNEQHTSNINNETYCVEANTSLELKEIDQQEEELANKQTQLTQELKLLTRQLAYKKDIYDKLAVQDSNYKEHLKLKAVYEKQINELVSERNELLNSIKILQSTNKESELKSKQLELSKKNHEIDLLQKKLENQSIIIKQKEAAEKKVESLSREIMQMKHTKVKLVKEMKTESEKFRAWRISREKEASKLRDMDRKRQNEMAKMVTLHHKQQNVYKRKLEEAVACNKRLKEIMSRQKVAQERRLKGNKEQMQEWVAQELEVLVSVADARQNVDLLVDDRATLTQQVMQLKKIVNDANTRQEDRLAAEKEIKEIESLIEVRNVQINDLNIKIHDSESENKINSRVNSLQSMSEAKSALKYVFDLVTEFKKDVNGKDNDYKEMQVNYDNMVKKNDDLMKQLTVIKQRHAEELLRLENDMLKEQNKENENPDLNITFTLEVTKELDHQKERCKKLQEQLTTISQAVHTPKMLNKRKRTSVHREYEDLDLDSEGSFVDDIYKDPDFRNTPLHKILKEHKSQKYAVPRTASCASRKRSADDSVLCNCTTTCSSNRCNCRKKNHPCSALCKCNPEVCTFQQNTMSGDNELLNTTMLQDCKKMKTTPNDNIV